MRDTGAESGKLGKENRLRASEMVALADRGKALAQQLEEVAKANGRNAKSAEQAGVSWGLFKKGLLAGAGFAAAQVGIAGLTGAIDTLKDGIGEVLRVGAGFETLEKQLETLYKSSDQAKAATGWISEFGKTAPFELNAITDAFTKLKTFGLDPMDGSFQAISDQSAALGASSQTLEGIVLALGQAWTKQKLQGEEALQLIERGVPVWDLLSKATGKSTVALQEMSAAGQLGRKAIRALIDEMGRANEGAGEKALQTWNGQIMLLRSNWQGFLNQIAQSGVLDVFREELTTINKAVKELSETGQLKRWAKEASDAIVSLYSGLKAMGEFTAQGVGFVRQYSGELELLAKVAIGIKALGLGKTFLGWGEDAVKGAAMVSASASTLHKAGLLAASGWMGWQVGSYLREEFEVIEKAGIALAAGLTREAAKARGEWEMFQALFTDDTVEAAQERLRVKLQQIDDEYADLFVSAGKARDTLKEQAGASKEAADAAEKQAATTEKVATASLSAADAAKEMVEQFAAAKDGAGGVAGALEAMGNSLKFTDQSSVAAFTMALTELGNTGEASAKQVGDAWRAALSKASVQDLEQLSLSLTLLKDKGVITAAEWAQANDQILGASFDRLGVNAAQALGRVSDGAQDAIRSVQLVADSAEAAGVQTAEAARAIEMAFAAAIPKADSLEALDAMQKQLKALGEAGKISADGVQRTQAALDKQRATIEGQLPGIQSLGEALRELGVKPQAELKAMAETAKQAFDAVKANGTATPREINAAWKAMAEAAIAANDGVADSTIQAQAAAHGFAIKTDEAGKSIVESMKKAEDATKGVANAAKGAAAEMEGMANAAWNANEDLLTQARRHNAALGAMEGTWIDVTAAASQYSQQMAELVYQAGKNVAAMTREHAALVEQMEALARQQQQVEESGGDAARGVDDLRLRLLELKGTEEEIAAARHERDEAEIRRKQALMQIDLQRAQINKDDKEAARLQQEIDLLGQQLVLLGEVFNEQERLRKAKARGGSGSGGGSGGSGGSDAGGGAPRAGGSYTVNLVVNGINDPVLLARKLEPELKKLQQRAR